MRTNANSFSLLPRAIEAVPNRSGPALRKMRTRRSSCVLWAVALVSLGLFAAGASAAQLNYEMDVNPDDALLGANAMTKANNGWGGIAAGDFNDPPAAGLGTGVGGYAPSGYARFVDSGNTGRNGYFRSGFAGAWTADMRIFVEQSTGGSGTIGKSTVQRPNSGAACSLVARRPPGAQY